MKFIKLALCLILISSYVIEIQGRNKNLVQNKNAKSQKTATKNFWNDWNIAKIEIKNSYGTTFNFGCNIKKVVYIKKDKEGQDEAFGIEFGDMDKVTQNDKSGFFKSSLSYEIVNEDGTPSENKLPIVDFRQIKDCQIKDNSGDWTGDWLIEFDVQAYEEYTLSKQEFGSLWTVYMTLPHANKQEATDIIKYLNVQCQARNQKINALKKTAIEAGDKYNQAFRASAMFETNLIKQIELGDDAQSVYNKAKTDGNANIVLQASIVSKNQEELDTAIKSLQEVTKASTVAGAKTDEFAKDLAKVQIKLQNLKVDVNTNQELIRATQQNLNAANKIKKSKQSDKEALVANQAKVQASKAAEAAEIARIVTSNEARMTVLKNEYAAKQKALDESLAASKAASSTKQDALSKQSKVIGEKKEEVDANIASKSDEIDNLNKKVEMLSEQSENLQDMIKNTKDSVTQIQNKLDESRSVADQLKTQIDIEKDIRESQLKEYETAKKNKADKQLKLIENQKINLAKLDQTKEEVKKLQEDFKKFEKETADSEKAFNAALTAIYNKANRALPRTTQAFIQSTEGAGGHRKEINAIVSQTVTGMRMALQRLAKMNSIMSRLARVQQVKINAVRLARKNNKASRKAKKAKKARRNKRAEQ